MNIKKNIKYLQKIKNGEISILVKPIGVKYGSLFPKGNKKLSKNIWSFSYNSATNCISDSLGLCSICGKCYGKRINKQYKNANHYDRQCKDFFYSHSAVQIAGYLIQKNYNSKKHPLKVLRLNVIGDFIAPKDLQKFDLIARYLYDVLGVQTYCYTKRTDLKQALQKLRYINVNISEQHIEGFNSFKAYESKEQLQQALKNKEITNICRCDDCFSCKQCITGKNLKIGCLFH